jgi:hypothetical protein
MDWSGAFHPPDQEPGDVVGTDSGPRRALRVAEAEQVVQELLGIRPDPDRPDRPGGPGGDGTDPDVGPSLTGVGPEVPAGHPWQDAVERMLTGMLADRWAGSLESSTVRVHRAGSGVRDGDVVQVTAPAWSLVGRLPHGPLILLTDRGLGLYRLSAHSALIGLLLALLPS